MTAMETAIQEEAKQRYRPYPAYKASGVEWLGEIPNHWDVKRLKNAVKKLETGGTPDSDNSDFWTDGDDLEGTAWVAISDMTRSFHVRETVKRLTTDGLLSKRLPVLPSGTLLYSMYASLGKVALLEIDAVVNQVILGIVPGTSTVSRDYLRWWLKFMQGHIQILSSSSTQENLNAEKVRNMPVFLPDEATQQAIATFLDRETSRIDALVAKKQRLIELLLEQRTALITRAVTMGLAASLDSPQAGTEIFPSIPLGWEMRKLRRILTQKKRPVEVQQDSDYQEIGLRSWGRGIFHKDSVKGSLLEEKSIYRIEPGDFVLNIVFAWEGAVAIASEQERGMVGSHRFPTFLVSDEVDPEYLLMVLQIEQGRWLMEVNSPGAAGRNKTIRLNQFLDEEIPLPPLSIQRELVCRVREEEKRLATLKSRLDEAINRLKELRVALVCAAVTGKIDVREEVV